MFLAILLWLVTAVGLQSSVRYQNVQRLMIPDLYQDQTWGLVLVTLCWANAATATTIGYSLTPMNGLETSRWVTSGVAVLAGIAIACHAWAVWLVVRQNVRTQEAEIKKHGSIEKAIEARVRLYREWQWVPELRQLRNSAEELVDKLSKHAALSGAGCAGFWLVSAHGSTSGMVTLQAIGGIGLLVSISCSVTLFTKSEKWVRTDFDDTPEGNGKTGK